MRAMRLAAAKTLEIVEIDDPKPEADEVLVRVAACGICGSDLSAYKTGVFAPVVLGHEFAGVITATGDGVDDSLVGTRVAVDPKTVCGRCDDCRSGSENRCIEGLTRGHGLGRQGGFAEQIAVRANAVHALPESVSLNAAALAEPLSVALHGLARAGVGKDDAIVLGLGSVGLLTVAALRAAGAGEVIGVDPVAARRAIAVRLGATAAMTPEELGAGDEAPLIVECSGRPEGVQEAANRARPGGRVLLLGLPMSEASVMPLVWVAREITLFGSVAQTPEELSQAIALLATTPEIEGIVSRTVALDAAPAAFEELLHPGDVAKVLVTP